MSTIRYNMPGAIDEPVETNSGLDLLPTNRTMLILPLNGTNGPRQPEEIPADYALSTERVMEYAKPSVKVALKTGDADNPEQNAEIKFQGGLDAFSPKEIAQKTPLLRSLQSELAISDMLIERIERNAQFRKALDNPEARAAMLALLTEIAAELDASLSDS